MGPDFKLKNGPKIHWFLELGGVSYGVGIVAIWWKSGATSVSPLSFIHWTHTLVEIPWVCSFVVNQYDCLVMECF